MSALDKQLAVLLRDFGYEVQGNLIVSRAVRGFCPRIVGRCRSMMDACEQLMPIIHDHDFTDSYNWITNIQQEGT